MTGCKGTLRVLGLLTVGLLAVGCRAAIAGKIESRIYQAQMAERLREIAEQPLVSGIVALRE